MQRLTRHFSVWLEHRPSPAATRWSRRWLAYGSLVALVETAILFARISTGETIGIPRFDGYAVSGRSGVAVLIVWAIGILALLSRRSRVRFGWLAAVGAVGAGLMDRQTLAGEIIYLVALFSLLHWVSAVLTRSEGFRHLSGAPLRVVQWQISVVFAWTAIAKMNPVFMSGGILSVAFDGPVPVPDAMLTQPVLAVLAMVTVIFEGTIAVGLWMRSFRRPLIIAAVLFHILIVLFLFPPVALVSFGLVMACGYALFADEPWELPTVDSPGVA